MNKLLLLISFLIAAYYSEAQRSDNELNRDSVTGWRYVVNSPNPKAVYMPIKSQYANGAVYSVWQQQASDMLINWIQQSYLPRGLVMRTIAKGDQRWYVDGNGPLHSYGVNFLGYAASFVQGKIDLHCCEQGQRLQAGFNDFPGVYINGFNPESLHFFAEQASFTSGDDDVQLSKEDINKKIQSSLYGCRTYLDHYHDNGQQMFKIGVVVPKNDEWPFKPLLVKDAVAYINQQLATYPDIMQKNPYSAEPVKKALERLKPYYNEVAKLKSAINYNNALNDGAGHYLLNPEVIINGQSIDKTFPEYNILVSTTQQTISQTKTDNPLWVYFNLTPTNVVIQGNLAKFDTKFGTGIAHMVYSLLHNFNFDYVNKWLSRPEAMKDVAYTPVNAPTPSSGNTISAPVNVSTTVAAKNKDTYTILYEDFDAYPAGTLSAKGLHTYGHDGHSFENATLIKVSGQTGKWISIPYAYTLYPDFTKPLPISFTVNYDVYFDSKISNKRAPVYFRLDTKDPDLKKSNPIDLHDINRNGFQFALALSGETEISKRFMDVKYDEVVGKVSIASLKENDVTHVSISVNGAAVSVSVNGKEVMHDNNTLPAGKTFKRCGWYCDVPGIYIGNIYIKSNMQ